MSANFEAHLDAVFGAQRSGKSCRMKIDTVIAKPPRLMVWDPKHEYSGFGTVIDDDLPQLARGVTGHDRFRLVFWPKLSRAAMRRQFDVFCKLANRATNVRLVVDELGDVTESNWAPEGWDIVTRQGGHARLVVQAASQRPAEVDKTFFGNATRILSFRLNADGDLDRISKRMRVPAATIEQLAKLEYFERDMTTGAVVKKKIGPGELKRMPL